jgi:hypothetical protein
MQFVKIYVGHQNVTNVVAKYDQKLLEPYKLLMFVEVQEFQDFGFFCSFSKNCSRPLTQM